MPLDWAMIQNNLGTALGALGERGNGTARLEDAVAAFRAALEERTRERVPLDWARTQTNLGTALQALGEQEDGTARLDEARAAYGAALQELTRERVPLDWARTHGMEGVALGLIAERSANLRIVTQAINQMIEARNVLRELHARWAAYFEERLEAAEAVRDTLLQSANAAAR